MRREDPDDPFDDIFSEIERMMNDVTEGIGSSGGATGFGGDAHVSVYETDDHIEVIADLPGVTKDDIGVKCDGERVTIAASTEHSNYEERIDLPAPVDEHSAGASFNNGVLQITFDRAGHSANIDLS